MIYANKNRITGRLTGRYSTTKPKHSYWTEYETREEFEADWSVDKHDLKHTPTFPDPNCEWCESEGWL